MRVRAPTSDGLAGQSNKQSACRKKARVEGPALSLGVRHHQPAGLGQEAVDEKSNEITATPALPERIDLTGALISIDAMGCHANIARGADYLLAVKDNQPTLHADIESYFYTAPAEQVELGERRQGAWQ
jgi:hypothetical protein